MSLWLRDPLPPATAARNPQDGLSYSGPRFVSPRRSLRLSLFPRSPSLLAAVLFMVDPTWLGDLNDVIMRPDQRSPDC